jgi:hypothetical protein
VKDDVNPDADPVGWLEFKVSRTRKVSASSPCSQKYLVGCGLIIFLRNVFSNNNSKGFSNRDTVQVQYFTSTKRREQNQIDLDLGATETPRTKSSVRRRREKTKRVLLAELQCKGRPLCSMSVMEFDARGPCVAYSF